MGVGAGRGTPSCGCGGICGGFFAESGGCVGVERWWVVSG